MRKNALQILYIAGAGRSGSTLLGDILGQMPGMLHVGELRGIFDYTTIPDGVMLCSCGRPYSECSFWNPIFEAAFGRDWPIVFNDFRVERNLPRAITLPFRALSRSIGQDLLNPGQRKTFTAIVSLLRVIAEKHPGTIIIDSSKSGAFGWILAQQPGVSMIAVHLVRDPRATVFSWVNRPIPLVEPFGVKWRATIRTMDNKAAIEDWIRANGSAWLMKWLGIPYMRIRYESFVEDPAGSVESILRFAQHHGFSIAENFALLSRLKEKRFCLGERHLIGANPRVKSQREVQLREDIVWLRETPWPKRLLWTIIFLPWLLWYGYSLWPRKQDPETPDDEALR
jgi:hypothetical protein